LNNKQDRVHTTHANRTLYRLMSAYGDEWNFNWELDPVTGMTINSLRRNWRRKFWHEFRPRITYVEPKQLGLGLPKLNKTVENTYLLRTYRHSWVALNVSTTNKGESFSTSRQKHVTTHVFWHRSLGYACRRAVVGIVIQSYILQRIIVSNDRGMKRSNRVRCFSNNV